MMRQSERISILGGLGFLGSHIGRQLAHRGYFIRIFDKLITSNVATAANWLQQIGKTRLRKILYFSSGGTVYGVPENTLITEDQSTNPINSYGITKLTIEKYTAMYAKQFGVDYCLLRPSNVYGSGQRLHVGQGVIGVMANRALRGERLEVWGAGTHLRDYLFVDDLGWIHPECTPKPDGEPQLNWKMASVAP
jgi:nucleoside-diphosphate-sugar epimerase